MPEKKTYIAAESFRHRGQTYRTGDSLELTAEEAAFLAEFLEDAPATLPEAGKNDAAEAELQELRDKLQELGKQLKAEADAKAELRDQLDRKERDLAALQDAADKTANDLTAANEQLADLGKQLADLKKAGKDKGGK